MKQALFLSIVLGTLSFLDFSSVNGMEGEIWKGLRKKVGKLSAGCSVKEHPDEEKEGLLQCTSSVVSLISLPTPHIRIETDVLCINGSINIPGKGVRPPVVMHYRTAQDKDFLLGEGKYVGLGAIGRLGVLTEDVLGPYHAAKLGPVTIQRGDPTLMEYIINGPRPPRETIGTHWFGDDPGWAHRRRISNPTLVYVMEEEKEGGGKDFKGHFLLGALSPTELGLSIILEQEDWGKGIGEGVFRYVLETLIPELRANDLTKKAMSSYRSLVVLIDDKNPIVAAVIRRIEEFQMQNPRYNITCKKGVQRKDSRPGYEARTRYQWTFALDSFKK